MIIQDGKEVHFLTINTDASFCPKTHAGGYAYWIKHDRFTIKTSYFFRDTIENIQEAEMKCICNSIAKLLSVRHPVTINKVIINTDSKNCIDSVENGSTDLLTSYLNKLVGDLELLYNCKVYFRHVESHSYKTNPRNMVNKWCDKNARKQMKVKRKMIQDAYKKEQSSEEGKTL